MPPTGLGPENLQQLEQLQNETDIDSITTQLSTVGSTSPLNSLQIRHASLSALTCLDRDDLSSTARSNLASAVSHILQILERDTDACALTAEAGLAVLAWLGEGQADEALVTVVGYTDATDAWTTEPAAATACQILANNLPGRLDEFIVGPILQDLLRPVFSKSNKSVTADGRPAHTRQANSTDRLRTDPPSWKGAGLHVVPVFSWAVRSATETLIAKNWPLFIPVLITLSEDSDLSIRQRGLDILTVFLSKCPLKTLKSTGIDAVLWDTAFPSLLFLPTLTPEEESVPLLRAAYQSLLTIALLDGDQQSKWRRDLLDKVIRDGILTGYAHAPEHIRVVEVLMQATTKVVEAQGIYAVKHLSSLLDVFSAILTDSFALAYAPAVLAAAESLNTTLAACWPRLSETSHMEQTVYIISVCWINIEDRRSAHDGDVASLAPISQQLKRTSTLLQALWDANGNKPADLTKATEAQPNLQALFTKHSSV